jgi:carbamoyltransferase
MARILGISGYYHDSAAALVVDGELVSAAQEERFTRIKHDRRFPSNAIRFCLSRHGMDTIDHVVFYDKPLLKFDRILETHLTYAPAGVQRFTQSMPSWLKEKLFLKQ